MKSPANPVLLVTGGGRGMGAATARLAAGQGWAVAVNYRCDAKAAEEVARAIVWLLSEDAGYTTTSLLDVSGGR